jgi:hypothetical protein
MRKIREFFASDPNRLLDLSPVIVLIMADLVVFGMEHGIEITFTDSMSDVHEDTILDRQSDTHRTGRAFDLRTRGLSADQIDNIKSQFHMKYRRFAAVNKFGHHILIVDKSKTDKPHLHFQVHRSYGVKEKTYSK